MSGMRFETPAQLFARLKLGREEFLQRLLTSLILRGPYPKWNTRSSASEEGIAFLRDLYRLSFGNAPWPGDEFVFVDEFSLPARTSDEKGGYPDYALLWDDRVWIVELKTEAGSHRADQIPMYFAFARHHHPRCAIDLTYLTGPGSKSGESSEDWEQFAHVEWADVRSLIEEHWPAPDLPGQSEVVDGVLRTIDGLGDSTEAWRYDMASLSDVVPAAPPSRTDQRAAVLDMVEDVAADGEHRAVELEVESLDELHELRLEVQDRLAALPEGDERRSVRPWVWNAETTDGSPMTETGRRHGHELRLSRYARPQY